MKKSFKYLVLLLVFVCTTNVYSQTKTKLGHIDSNKLMVLLPGRDTIQTKLEKYKGSLESQLKTMYGEYQVKQQELQSGSNTMAELIKQAKMKELDDLAQRIQDFQQSAEDDFKKKEQELLQPLITKAKTAIEEVAKENGYKYIFDVSLGVILYFEEGDDVLPLVKKKLGIK
ncbi:MAG: hypothetical protein A2X12_09120 [Bacteroidetes bacterium GWE2_29_8]|nr:MAG: hypothetical protein A2X12_09120 [Bacteroidetes bacterium GWE2_29_8]